MRFSTIAVLSVLASASAFVPSANRAFTRSQPLFALEDLEAKLLAPPPPKAAKVEQKPKPAPREKVEKPKPEPKVKVEKPKPVPRGKAQKPKVEAPAPAPAPVPAPAPAPVPAAKSTKSTKKLKKGDYDFSEIAEKKKAPVKLQAVARTTPKVVTAGKGLSFPALPTMGKNVAAPKTPVVSDPNAGLVGVALGAAPLLLAPVVALSVGRDFLTKTSARRAEIEKDIAARAAEKARKDKDAEVDAGGLVKAAVSRTTMVTTTRDDVS